MVFIIIIIISFNEKLNTCLLGPQKAMNLHLKKKPLDQKRLSNELKSLIGFAGIPFSPKLTAKAPGKVDGLQDDPFLSVWWFQIFFIFTPTWGNDPI